ALFMYRPGTDDTVTSNVSVMLLEPGMLNGPAHVRTCAATDGLAVVAPVVEPLTYANPGGRTSMMLSTEACAAFGFVTVIVYESVADGSTAGSSAALVTCTGSSPTGENVVRCEIVNDAPAASVRFQSIAAPLSSSVVQMQVSGSSAPMPIVSQTVL